MYYFAYGSNMNKDWFKTRCPYAKPIAGPFYLENSQFIYDGESSQWNNKAVANIISRQNSKVWGGLYEILSNDLDNLDHHEGYPNNYGKGIVIVKDKNKKEYPAWVYYRVGQKEGLPSDDYKKCVLKGAKDFNLPEEYITKNLI